MRTVKIFILFGLVSMVGIWGCAKEQKVETPKEQQITKDLLPSHTELKSQNFLVELKDLKVQMTVDNASKDILQTPSLSGNLKITNESKDNMDIQGVSLQYLDEAGKPIAFSSGEKSAKVSLYQNTIKPGESTEASLSATIPRAALKEKALGNVEINLVYVPSPVRRDTFTVPEKLG